MKFHYSIPVINMIESEEFYEWLGFRHVNEWSRPEKDLEAVVMENDGCTIELVYHPTHKFLVNPELMESRHLGLEVSNLEKTINDLKDNEVEIIKPITEGITVKRFAFVKDPNGFPIELFESRNE